MHDLATLGLQIAGFAGLATVLGFLWSLIKAAAETQKVVKELPTQVKGVGEKTDSIAGEVREVRLTVDQLSRDHAQTRRDLSHVQEAQAKTETTLGEVKTDLRVMKELDQFQAQERIRRRMDPEDRAR